jgi:hypothetical protein
MRTQPSYPITSFPGTASNQPHGNWIPLLLTASLLLLTLATSCYPTPSTIEELPRTTTILLDFSDPNIRLDGTGGYQYQYNNEYYPATYNAWQDWSCPTGPDCFAAWDDTSNSVWLAHCPATLNLESITTQTGNSDPLPIVSYQPVTGAHEPTYQLTLNPATYVDIENGATTITLSFTYN